MVELCRVKILWPTVAVFDHHRHHLRFYPLVWIQEYETLVSILMWVGHLHHHWDFPTCFRGWLISCLTSTLNLWILDDLQFDLMMNSRFVVLMRMNCQSEVEMVLDRNLVDIETTIAWVYSGVIPQKVFCLPILSRTIVDNVYLMHLLWLCIVLHVLSKVSRVLFIKWTTYLSKSCTELVFVHRSHQLDLPVLLEMLLRRFVWYHVVSVM